MRHAVLLLGLVTLGLGEPPAGTPPPSREASAPATEAAPEAPFDDAAAIAELRKVIAGREREPAETVFSNIQIHKGKPAAAILSIMEIGYRRSLGVHCTHCHDPRDWASDGKQPKKIAREMSSLVRTINEQLFPSIQGLRSERPVVNCTTCHRGNVTPALDLEKP